MKSLYLAIIALFFGTGFGFLLAVSSGAELEGHDHAHGGDHGAEHGAEHGEAHDHSDPTAHGAGTGHLSHDTNASHAGHAHAMLDISEEPGMAPGLTLALHHDAGNSYNLEVQYQHFDLRPERVNGPHIPGTGHAHIFVDGVKLTRLYSDWFLLSNLTPGAEVKVTLNANSHEQLMHDGQAIEATIIVPSTSAATPPATQATDN